MEVFLVVNKVEICGVNTSELPLLTKQEKDELFIQIKQFKLFRSSIILLNNICCNLIYFDI